MSSVQHVLFAVFARACWYCHHKFKPLWHSPLVDASSRRVTLWLPGSREFAFICLKAAKYACFCNLQGTSHCCVLELLQTTAPVPSVPKTNLLRPVHRPSSWFLALAQGPAQQAEQPNCSKKVSENRAKCSAQHLELCTGPVSKPALQHQVQGMLAWLDTQYCVFLFWMSIEQHKTEKESTQQHSQHVLHSTICHKIFLTISSTSSISTELIFL